jgi:serine/threonine protein kinase
MSDDSQPGASLVGAVLADSYRLTRLVGRGGMGAVYEGEHLRLGQRVAVKVMAAELAANREALARFRREAEVTSRLRHPHIVHVFDVGSAPSGEPFLVMEYLAGEDLEHRIVRLSRLPLGAVVHIVKQTAAALAAAHAKGIVHRDLKPANIFLVELEGEADFVKIVDFGISKVRAATTKLTRSSVVMGTPDYMSPEQARGHIEEIDHRTDQWALAAITYEMLCGRTPFAGEDVASVLYQVTREEPRPLSSWVGGVPSDVEVVVGRGLAKRASHRYASITAFSQALEQAAASAPPAAGTNATPVRRRVATPPSRTVAYGPSSASAGRGEFAEPTTVDPRLPEVIRDEPKTTTFSHATGEATRLSSWKQLRLPRRWALPAGVGLAALASVLVYLRLSRHPSEPVGMSAAAPAAAAARPQILPMRAAPAIVGPPTPINLAPETSRTDGASGSTRTKRKKPSGRGALPNPFDEETPVRPPPAAPASPLPSPHSRRQIIKEL